MKKWASLIIFVLLLSSFPFMSAQPWVTVFEGRVKIGESLILGEYKIYLTLEKNEMKPYAIIYEDEEIKKIVGQGNLTEVGSMRVVLGSYNAENEDVFVALQYKPPLTKEIAPKNGASFEVGDYSIKVTESGNESVLLSINGDEIEVKANSVRVHDKLALEYTGDVLGVYYANVEIDRERRKDYEVYYPFKGLKVKAGDEVQIPITVYNNGNKELTLQLKILSKPLGWDVRVLDESGKYEVNEIALNLKASAVLTLFIKIPEDASGTKRIRFAVGEEIGEITLDVIENEGIDVIIPMLGVETEAGQSVTFPIILKNRGEEKAVKLEVTEKPAGWNAYFLMGNQRVKSFLLEGEQGITLFVEAPRNAELGEHKLGFSINGIEKNVSVFIYKTYKGEPAKIVVTAKDEEGNFVQGAKISTGNKTAFTDGYGRAKIELKPGEYKIFVEKEGYELVEKEVSVEDGEEKTLEITLTKLPYYFELEGSGDTVAIVAGSIGRYAVTIKNLGKEEDWYSLSAFEIPEGWSAEFYYAESPIRKIKISPGESKEVALRIVPPFNAQPGEYNLTIVVKSSSGLEKRINLVVKLIGEYKFEMYPETPMVNIKAGKDGIAYLSLENTGTAPITNIKFEVSAPQGWDVKVTPQVIPELGSLYFEGGVRRISGSENRLTVTIKVPETTPAGTYQITITGKGDQAQASTQITVRVTQSSNTAYIGILILVLTFGGVIWMMRKVGRR
ncbi:NEW3 domain-containing protein [Thermococcus alcaliphilus]|uniref:NEW3 domain-containing protein n=1 Tax=Thermococcus alcaliphilus TaxID=139207 RepID=UPI0020907815|nr:NEW3 domain-containing protein [Thermococcus alcaliphilus]MCO6041736.1 NEW3 domain-containing protein [Thermococcus alcaliphilus]